MTDYHSFLICFHPGHTDVFRNGLPLGVVRNGVFHVHTNRMPDGTEVPVQIAPDTMHEVLRTVGLMQERDAHG